MIRFTVTTVTRKSSSEVSTIRYKHATKEGEELQTERSPGAEWEEIEFAVEREDKPVIQIANIAGNALLVGNPKLIINNPDLFGVYKTGDIIEFMPIRLTELSKSN